MANKGLMIDFMKNQNFLTFHLETRKKGKVGHFFR